MTKEILITVDGVQLDEVRKSYEMESLIKDYVFRVIDGQADCVYMYADGLKVVRIERVGYEVVTAVKWLTILGESNEEV